MSFAASAEGSVAGVVPVSTTPSHLFTLDDEEISDVSLATFHLYDNESLAKTQSGLIQMARGCGCGHGCGHGGGRGCGGFRGCGGRGCGGCRGCGGGWRGCGIGWGGCGGCGWGWCISRGGCHAC
ncbi:hypothetical protein [Methyloferula stellata]|uniref:hypothetical protein n=1 Tax=Methyloferula stellata TaxID=876270 RepID=UPI00190F1BCA|nr:hypothetical protein [Methyloferula stellata]